MFGIKKSTLRIMKTILVVVMIVGLFNPYISETIPLEYLLIDDTLTILPKVVNYIIVIFIAFYLYILLYQNLVDKKLWLHFIGPFLISYILVVINEFDRTECFYFFEAGQNVLWEDLIILMSSITLLAISFAFAKTKFQLIENIILATLLMPMVYYFHYFHWNMHFELNWQVGFYFIHMSYFMLLFLALLELFVSVYWKLKKV